MSAARLTRWFALTLAWALTGVAPATPTPTPAADPPALVVEGLVTDGDGRPVPGAVVLSTQGGRTHSDALGAYRLVVPTHRPELTLRLTGAATTSAGQLLGSQVLGASPGATLLRAPPLALTAGGTCEPSWLPTFGGLPGADDQVTAVATYDAGSGPELYVGGRFDAVGGVVASRIARWDGSAWSAVGGGLDTIVYALQVFDDGSGPVLYAGGAFQDAGGSGARYLARWDGTAWSPIGDPLNGDVRAMLVHDDGAGPALYVTGNFLRADSGIDLNRVGRWDGSAWSALGDGLSSRGEALALFDAGSGDELIVAGLFQQAGGQTVDHVARWDGSQWQALGTGVDGQAHALAVYDEGAGPRLFVGGFFDEAGGLPAEGLARWDGSAWSAMGAGADGAVRTLHVSDVGGQTALYAGGSFDHVDGVDARGLARYDGSSWSAMAGGPLDHVECFATVDLGPGPELVAGGLFTVASVAATHLARWDGSAWHAYGSGLDGAVNALAVYDEGHGPELFAGGDFANISDSGAGRLARWDGAAWVPVGGGLDGPVRALAVYDDGAGPRLFVGGDFTQAGGVTAPCIAAWDGSAFAPVGPGFFGAVEALVVFDDGGGPRLVAGGRMAYTFDFSLPLAGVASWDGTAWQALGGGVSHWIHALCVHDDGSGPRLYAGGDFVQAEGQPANRMAVWDGATWEPLGAGVDGTVHCLSSFDAGGSRQLAVGGAFVTAGGQPAAYVASWDGAAWAPLGAGLDEHVRMLISHDDGHGPALYAGLIDSVFVHGVPGRFLARWDGGAWQPLGAGTTGDVLSAAVWDDPLLGPTLVVGGWFGNTPDAGDGPVARFGGCAAGLTGWTDLGSALAGAAGDPLFEASGSLAPYSFNATLLSQAAPSALAGLFVALSGGSVPFKGGLLVPVPHVVLFLLPTDGAGRIPIDFVVPPGLPPGTSFWVQWAIDDAAAVQGVALSNALRGDTPAL